MTNLTTLFHQSTAFEKLKCRVARGCRLTPDDISDLGIGSKPHTRWIIATMNGVQWEVALREAIRVA